MKNTKVYLTPEQAKSKVKEFITINKQLESLGRPRLALSFVGFPGLGKTSSILQLQEEGIGVKKVNMANIDDLGEVLGYPLKQYKLTKEGNTIWANDKNYEHFICEGFTDTLEIKTGYAEPEWVNELRGHETTILLLDDLLRAQPRFINALMDLIYMGQYYGWKLPKGCNIVMTNNPQDADFQVSQEDNAHQTRYFTFHFKFDIDSWVRNSVKEGINENLINFIIKEHSSLFDYVDPKNPSLGHVSCPRQWTLLFYTLMNEEDLNTNIVKEKIINNGSGIMDGQVVQHLVNYINSPDYYMVSPEFIFNSKHKDSDIYNEIIKSIGGKFTDLKKFKSASAAVLSNRIRNYLIQLVEDKGELPVEAVKRLEWIFDEGLLGGEFASKIIVELYNYNSSKVGNLMSKSDLVKYLS